MYAYILRHYLRIGLGKLPSTAANKPMEGDGWRCLPGTSGSLAQGALRDPDVVG